MLLYKTKKIQPEKGNRLLISITVVGSAGPIRFVVNEKELVANVIDTAMKNYAREGRLPVLGSNLNDFVLYCPTVATEGIDSIAYVVMIFMKSCFELLIFCQLVAFWEMYLDLDLLRLICYDLTPLPFFRLD